MKTLARHIAESLDSLETCGAYEVTGDVGDLEDAIAAAIKIYEQPEQADEKAKLNSTITGAER